MRLPIRTFWLAYHKLLTSPMVWLIASLLLAIVLPGCVLLDFARPNAEIRQQAPPQYRSTPRPTTQSLKAPITLAKAIEISLANNPHLAAARHGVDAASAHRDVAFAAILPTISLQGGYTFYREERLIKPRRPGTAEVLGFTDQLVTGDIVLTMPLYMGGRLINSVKAADLIAQSAKEQLVYSRTELVFNVSSVFYSMLGQRKVIDSLMFSQKALEEHQRIVAELIDAQKAAKVDLLRTEVRLADIAQRLIHEGNVLNIKRCLLASLLGLGRENQSLQIEGELILTDVHTTLVSDIATALDSRQDYQSLKSKINAQQRNLDIAKGKLLPEVFLRASYGKRWSATSSDLPTDDNEVGEIGAFVMIPLFQGGRIICGIRRERSLLRAQRAGLRELELRIQLEVETAISKIESTRARVGVTGKAVEQGSECLRIEREKYNLGKGAIVDVLDAQSALLDSQTNYYRALADYMTAVAQFRLAVGEEQ
jgi:outer membrane protein